MARNVAHVKRAPKPPARRKGRENELQDFVGLVWRNRMKLPPYVVLLFVVGLVHALTLLPVNVTPWVGIAVGLGVPLAMWRTDVLPKLNRSEVRRYVSCVAAFAGAWTAWATWHTAMPSLLSLVGAFWLTTALAVPWWWRRSAGTGLPVDVDGLTPAQRRKMLRAARNLSNRWDHAMATIQAPGTRITTIGSDAWSLLVDVTLTMTLEEFRKRSDRLEHVLNVNRGSVRIEARGKKARHARIRIVLTDPHADPIPAPEPSGDPEWLGIGKFETGEEVRISLRQHMLIAGRSGAGKSVLLQIIVRALTRIPSVAIVALDLKPGAVELGRWEPHTHTVGKSADDARTILAQLRAGLARRGDVMAAKGWQSWKADAANPWIVLVVDEAQKIVEAKLEKELADVAALLRAYGGTLVLATQYPIKENIPPTVKEQIVTTIGLKTKSDVADRVIFGENAGKEGWACSKIPADRKGSFYIESDEYQTPVLARVYFLDDAGMKRAVETAPPGVRVDAVTWPRRESVVAVGELEASEGRDEDGDEIQDAVMVAEEIPADPGGKVVWALRSGASHRTEIETMTELSQKTVDKYLTLMIAEGKVDKIGRAMYRLS